MFKLFGVKNTHCPEIAETPGTIMFLLSHAGSGGVAIFFFSALSLLSTLLLIGVHIDIRALYYPWIAAMYIVVLFQGWDSPNSCHNLIRISLPVSTTYLFRT
jgi:hypothetical protein